MRFELADMMFMCTCLRCLVQDIIFEGSRIGSGIWRICLLFVHRERMRNTIE